MKKYKIYIISLLVFFLYSCTGTKYIEINFEPTDITSLEDINNYANLAIQSNSFDVDTLAVFTENYFLESQIVFNQKMIKYEKKAALFEEGKIKNLPALPVSDHREFITDQLRLTDKFRKSPAIAPTVYTIGYAYFDEGNIDKTIETFEFFLENFKTSHLHDEVSFRLGEIYFDTNQLQESLEAYDKIEGREHSPFYIRAIFKKAWVHFRLDQFNKAIDSFTIVIDDGIKPDREVSSLDLSTETKKTVVKIISELKPTGRQTYSELLQENIQRFQGKPYTLDLFLDLAELLKNQSRYEEMQIAYDVFISNFKGHKKLPTAYIGLAESYDMLGKKSLALKTRKSTADKFNPATKWYKRHFKNGDDLTDKLVSEAMLVVADHHRKKSRSLDKSEKIQITASLISAIKYYKKHLEFFEHHESSNTSTLYLAESLFDVKSYNEAATYYTKAMELNRYNENGDKAAISALLTLELLIAEKTPKDEKIKEEDALVLAEKIHYVESFFRDGFIGSRVAGKFYDKISNLYFLLDENEKAIESLNSLIYEDGPSAKNYEKLGDAYAATNKIDDAIEKYGLALRFKKKNEQSSINTKLSALYYKKAQTFREASLEEGSKDLRKEAIDNYYKAFTADKESVVGENSLLNIGKLHIEAENTREVITITRLMKQYHSRSENYPPFLVDTAKLLKEKSRFLDAAQMLEDASIVTKNKTFKQTYIFESLALLEFSGQSPKLIRKLQSHMNSKIIAPERMAQALYMLGSAQVKDGDEERGITTFKKAINQKSTKDNDYFRTKARLKIAEIKTQDFVKLKLTLPFEKSFAKKESLMRDILTDYKYALETKIADLLPETFYHMGQVLENLSSSLIDSEKPKNLTEEEKEEYNFQLVEKAYPIDEEAIKAYTSSIKASTDHKIESKYTLLSIKKLSALRPASYNRPLKLPTPIFVSYSEPDLSPMIFNEYSNGDDMPDISDNSPKAIGHYNKGLKLFEKKPKKSLSHFDDAIEVMPGFSEAYLMKSYVNIGLGEEELALENLNSSTEGTRKLKEAYSLTGVILLNKGDIEGAEEAFQNSLDIKETLTALVNFANIKHSKEDFQVALKYYKMAERLEPKNTSLNFNIGLNFHKKGEIKKAAVYINKSLPLVNELPKRATDIATALLLSGRVDSALKTLVDIKKKQPGNAQAHKILGIIYELYKNDYKAAALNYSKYLKLGGKDTDAVFNWITIAKQKDKR